VDDKLGGYVGTGRVAARGSRRAGGYPLLVKQGVNLGVLAACNAGLAVVSAWYVVTHTGINAETDAFFASGALPQLAFLVMSATLLPVLVPLLATRDGERLRADAWAFFVLTTAFFALLGAALYVSAGLWVPLLVPGFSPEAKELTVGLTRVQVVSMVLNAGIVSLWAAHHARGRFVWVELSGVLANLAGLAFLVWALPRFGIRAAAWNAVFYNCLKLALLAPVLGRWRRPLWGAVSREAWRLLKPLLPLQGYLRAEPALDRFLTSMQGAGSLSLLYVAQQVYASAAAVTGKAFVAPMVPRLAVEADAGDWRHYRHTYRVRLALTVLLTSAGALLVLALGAPALRLTVGHGGIAAENVHALWLVLVALAGSLVGGVSGQVASGAFYAMGDTKTPAKVSAFVYTLYLPLKVAVFLRYGLVGLAVTTSAYFVVNALVQLLMLEAGVSRLVSSEAPADVEAPSH
jgi:peptidoglycan biosynthesis protein MviN/MurJ (putative lipid II flippase)